MKKTNFNIIESRYKSFIANQENITEEQFYKLAVMFNESHLATLRDVREELNHEIKIMEGKIESWKKDEKKGGQK